jgi:BirA family transcriptional regulator, biotin operon repressor / biotin---[acetyl-CoA-carboxylase] ligase
MNPHPPPPPPPDRWERLRRNTFLREIRDFSSLDSTNSRALELLEGDDPIACPGLIHADEQTAGRGRGANRWWSSAGGLTCSLVLDVQSRGLTSERTPLVSLLTGLAVLQACQAELPRADFALKWPNDVYLSQRKLAGILVELPPGRTDPLVIGMGINVNNSFEAAPGELRESAVSLKDVGGRESDPVEILERLLRAFEDLLQRQLRGEDVIQQQWPAYCLLTGKTVTVTSGARTVSGLCLGIDSRGALRLQTASGEERFFGGTVGRWESR